MPSTNALGLPSSFPRSNHEIGSAHTIGPTAPGWSPRAGPRGTPRVGVPGEVGNGRSPARAVVDPRHCGGTSTTAAYPPSGDFQPRSPGAASRGWVAHSASRRVSGMRVTSVGSTPRPRAAVNAADWDP